jgi:hypothetical protein
LRRLKFIIVLEIFLNLNLAKASDSLALADLNKTLNNPSRALKSIYDSPEKWSEYLKHISKGEKEWLETWPTLRKVSDAGASEDLDLQISKVLKSDPTLVFNLIKRRWQASVEQFKITRSVCAASAEESQEVAVSGSAKSEANQAYIQTRIERINGLRIPGLDDLKKECLAQLKLIK